MSLYFPWKLAKNALTFFKRSLSLTLSFSNMLVTEIWRSLVMACRPGSAYLSLHILRWTSIFVCNVRATVTDDHKLSAKTEESYFELCSNTDLLMKKYTRKSWASYLLSKIFGLTFVLSSQSYISWTINATGILTVVSLRISECFFQFLSL